MLSGRLIHLIEAHWDEIASRALRQIQKDPELRHIKKLSEAELREWGENLVANLGHWLAGRHEDELARHYETLGQVRFEQGVPLHEAVRGLCILKEKMIDFLEEQDLPNTAAAVYAEEELEHRVWRFFDHLTVHLTKGYEAAWRKAAHAVA